MVPHSHWLLLRHLLGLVILELNVQAILNPHLHLNRGVELWVGAQGVHNYVHLLHHIVQSAADSRSEEIPARKVPLLLGLYKQQERRSREGHGAERIALDYPSSLISALASGTTRASCWKRQKGIFKWKSRLLALH